MVSVNVVDGVAVYELDTSGMSVGDYVISAEYIVNDSYNGAMDSGSLVLEDVVNMVDLPIGVDDNWAFLSRGDGSTSPSINGDGTVQLGLYTYHVWKQAIDTSKKYTISFYKETIYGDLYIGVCNSNTGIPSRYPGMVINQSNAGITSQSINKASIFYNNSTEKWCIMINDNPQYVKEQMEHGDTRYISIRTETSSTASQNKILSITEEMN